MKPSRESNYDLLRILCAVAVITIHVSASYLGAATDDVRFGSYYQHGLFTTCLYNVLSRFAVPCFVMLSGAFILADERNADYKYFYRKTFTSVGVPTLVFSILYFLYSLLTAVLSVTVNGKPFTRLLVPVKAWIVGEPYYHMWYLYMMIGVYLLVPFLLLFKKQVGEKTFSYVTWIFLLWASASFLTSKALLKWDMGRSFEYLGYLMAGYELRKYTREKKDMKKGCFLIIAGIAVEILTAWIRYYLTLQGITESEAKYPLTGPLAPLIVLASVCIFAGFSYLDLQKNWGKLPMLTFYIYLLHALVWHILSTILYKIGCAWDNRIVIPVSILLVFLLSLLLSKLYLALWKPLEKKWNISHRLCRLLHLS